MNSKAYIPQCISFQAMISIIAIKDIVLFRCVVEFYGFEMSPIEFYIKRRGGRQIGVWGIGGWGIVVQLRFFVCRHVGISR